MLVTYHQPDTKLPPKYGPFFPCCSLAADAFRLNNIKLRTADTPGVMPHQTVFVSRMFNTKEPSRERMCGFCGAMVRTFNIATGQPIPQEWIPQYKDLNRI